MTTTEGYGTIHAGYMKKGSNKEITTVFTKVKSLINTHKEFKSNLHNYYVVKMSVQIGLIIV